MTNNVLRHCMVVHNLYPHKETRVERQAGALRDHGFAVDVICLRDQSEPPVETVNGIEVHRLPVRRHKDSGRLTQFFEYITFFVLVFFYLTKLHVVRRYQTIQVHNLPDFLVFVALAPKILGAKIILDLHDLMPEFYAERFECSVNEWPVTLLLWIERTSCRFADQIITVTELWRQTLIQRGQPPAKVSVVMNVPDSNIFGSEAPVGVASSRSNANQADEPYFRLIYHGTMAERYGLDLAIHAVGRLRTCIPNMQLILHGSGDFQLRLIELTKQLQLQDVVEFSTRSLPTDQLPSLLKQAQVALVPYRNGIFTGGILPTKMLEYAALGIPVIAARTPAIATYFDEDTVQFFSPGDVDELAQKILELYQDRQRLAQLAEQISAFSQRYQWRDVQAGYVELIKLLPNNHLATEVARDELVA